MNKKDLAVAFTAFIITMVALVILGAAAWGIVEAM